MPAVLPTERPTQLIVRLRYLDADGDHGYADMELVLSTGLLVQALEVYAQPSPGRAGPPPETMLMRFPFGIEEIAGEMYVKGWYLADNPPTDDDD